MTYHLHGLTLTSSTPLPWCSSAAVRNGVGEPVTLAVGPEVSLAKARRLVTPRLAPRRWFQWIPLPDGSEYLWWRGAFECLIAADGRRMDGRPLTEAADDAWRGSLFNQLCSFLLLKQGIEPLHATVVVVRGQAVGFLGDSGYGKSSLGAAFLRAGYPVLTDDLLVVRPTAATLLAYPGLPRIKLSPRVATAVLGANLHDGATTLAGGRKWSVPLRRGQCAGAPVPVKAFYVLPPPKAPRPRTVRLTPLTPRRACATLIDNTINPVVRTPERRLRQLRFAAHLAERVPLTTLAHSRRLADLPALRAAILADLAA